MVQLLNIMLTPNPRERPSITEIEYMVLNYAKLVTIEHNINHNNDDFNDFQQAPDLIDM